MKEPQPGARGACPSQARALSRGAPRACPRMKSLSREREGPALPSKSPQPGSARACPRMKEPSAGEPRGLPVVTKSSFAVHPAGQLPHPTMAPRGLSLRRAGRRRHVSRPRPAARHELPHPAKRCRAGFDARCDPPDRDREHHFCGRPALRWTSVCPRPRAATRPVHDHGVRRSKRRAFRRPLLDRRGIRAAAKSSAHPPHRRTTPYSTASSTTHSCVRPTSRSVRRCCPSTSRPTRRREACSPLPCTGKALTRC